MLEVDQAWNIDSFELWTRKLDPQKRNFKIFWSSWSKQGFKGPRSALYRKNYQHRSLFGRFLIDFEIFWGSFGDDVGVFWVGPRHVFTRKIDLYKFSKNQFFEDRCTVCSLKAQCTWSGSGPTKSKLLIKFLSRPGRPRPGLSSAGNLST